MKNARKQVPEGTRQTPSTTNHKRAKSKQAPEGTRQMPSTTNQRRANMTKDPTSSRQVTLQTTTTNQKTNKQNRNKCGLAADNQSPASCREECELV